MQRAGIYVAAAALLLAGCGQSQQAGAHYQTVRMDDNHSVIIDGNTGDVWYFTHAAVATSLRYVGHLKAGERPGEIVGSYHVNMDDFKEDADAQ